MPVVSMKKMSLVAHKGDRSRLLRVFTKAGCVEVTTTPLVADTDYPTDREKRSTLESKRLKVSFALTFMKESFNQIARITKKNSKHKASEYLEFIGENGRIEKKDIPNITFKKENRLVSFEEYYDVAKDEVEIFAKISELEKLNSRILDIKSEKARLTALAEQLEVYENLEIPFSEIKDTETCLVFAGTVPNNRVGELQEKLPERVEMTSYPGDKSTCVVFCAHKGVEKELNAILADFDFIRNSFDYDVTAAEKLKELSDKFFALEEEHTKTVLSVADYAQFVSKFKVLYDFYCIEISKNEAIQGCPHTQETFIMEGWVPANRVEELQKKVEESCKRTEIFFRDPYEEENPPTLVKENKLVRPFQGITDMFGVPGYRETDPNIFVAFFYFLIFGIMIGDAGYGLLMAIACFAYIKIVKPVKNSGMMIAMFGFCGISTFIWGALFGGWFAIEGISQTFLGKIVIFEPLTEPLKMFILALAVGVLQIGTGFAINGVVLIKNKKYAEGILGGFGWAIIMLGVLLLFPKVMEFLKVVTEPPAWFAVCSQIGMYTAIAGFVMMLASGALGKKNPLKMLIGVFKNAYGAINVVSDILSYSRLFGLGLTTGVIGLVVNKLATIVVNQFFGGLWVGWIFAAIVLVIGHAFNLGINLLGAYVHNSRLQYIEFFGRFYEGTGHAFKPLGGTAKYTYPDN